MDRKELRQLPPSERAGAEAEQQKQLAERAAASVAMMREDFGRTFQTEHGKRVLSWLYERCGYGKSKLAANREGVIDPIMTVHNAQEETLYIALRRFIPIPVLQQVEYGMIKPSGTIEPETKIRSKKKKGD